MGGAEKKEDAEDVLIPLADHQRPTRPTTNELKVWLQKVFALFEKDDAPFIASDKLHRTAASLLDKIASRPAFGSLTAGLEKSLQDWFHADSPEKRVRVIVVPPCDAKGLIKAWADEFGHEILRAPARQEINSGRADVGNLEGDGLLVIPHLEHWFYRSYRGLATVRALLEAIDRSERKFVVSCDSWAWAFLSKTVAVDLILPDPQTLRPFDGDMLRTWFAGLVNDSGLTGLRFRESATGKNLLVEFDDKDEQKAQSNFFSELAARSRGIPWVAWSLWRGSIRLEQEEKVKLKEEGGNKKDEAEEKKEAAASHADQQTLWVAALEEYSLPNEHRETALLVMHALLLHGNLEREEIAELLPIQGAREMLPALLRSGLVEAEDGRISVGSAAYPSIRAALATVGFSLDKL